MTTTDLRPPAAEDPAGPRARSLARSEEDPLDRIRPRSFRSADVADLLGASAGSFCLTWLVYERLTPLSGGPRFFVAWYALFLVTVWFLARERVGALHARDRLASVVVATVGIGMLI